MGNAKFRFRVTATVNLSRRLSKKRQTRTDEVEQKIMAMYAKGMSQLDIEDTIREIYGVGASQSLVSRITDTKFFPR